MSTAFDDFGTAFGKGGTRNGPGGNNATSNLHASDIGSGMKKLVGVRLGSTEGSGASGTVGFALVSQYETHPRKAGGGHAHFIDNKNPDVQAPKVDETPTDSFIFTTTDDSPTDGDILAITIDAAVDAPAGVDGTDLVGTSGVAGGNVLANDLDASRSLNVTHALLGAVEGSGTVGTAGAPTAGASGTPGRSADAAASAVALLTVQQPSASFSSLFSDAASTDQAALAVANFGPEVTVDGDLSEWDASQRLDDGTVAGYALYGDVQSGNFVFGIDAGSGTVGPNTTIWLDSDLNVATGFQIFGSGGGAEYRIEIDAGGVAGLYAGGSDTLIGPVTHAISADLHTAEFSVAAAALGGASAANVFVDVNNSVFLPASYANGGYRVGALPAVTFGTITIDGVLSDWTAPLNTPANSPAGYAFYGDVQSETFLFALSADSVKIGPLTTIWLDTDRDPSTGYQVFGSTVGAEYNIEIGIDHTARLYTGAAGETFVADLTYNYSFDQKAIEIALPANLMAGTPIGAWVYADINNTAFLPGDYANQSYSVGKLAPPLPVDPTDRIAIVYSQTSADNYFSKTAYGQLFMSAQNQAIQAGIPFDLLTEADLKDASKLVGYNAIVFPGLQNVMAADLSEITTALMIASHDYGVGLITQGNFLTNDETGAAFAGDSYARMKSLLGVTLELAGATSGITLTADAGAHPILSGYTPGEVVGTYTNTSFQAFRDISGTGQTLFSQFVDGVSRPAVIATTKGGNNVVFASDAIIGNNNILGKAIDWAVNTTEVDVGIELTRFQSIFTSRTDMDQSQETWDVIFLEPSIYDVMMPIMADWKEEYDFVGSFYINIGNNRPDQVTDWSISAPYYQQLLALGNQIGTHSYTHTDDTNVLVPTSAASQALLNLLAITNPMGLNPVDSADILPWKRDLLNTSFEFQFLYSKQIIEQQLGITVSGTALPGAPETSDTAHHILPYFDYISGGWSGIGGGYPGAFGFMTPADLGKVYLAPNMVFDFTLIGFLKLTPEQATARWLSEFETIHAHATTPIVLFPWHDYGVTNWDLGDPVKLNYSLEMFTAVLDAAKLSGAEFVTNEDLAKRIVDFQASNLTVSQIGNVVTATVTSPNAGKFALSFGDDATTIQSAAVGSDGWYAWNGNQLLLPQAGGTFTVTLGTPDDVTHLTALPMRADLTSVTGDGTSLVFAFSGEGTATVALKTQGTSAVIATGADNGSVAGGTLSLGFAGNGAHAAAISYVAGGAVTGTAANEVIAAGSGNDTIRSGGGINHVSGGAGADTFVFEVGSGIIFVQDFTHGLDFINLSGFGYATAEEARAAFTVGVDGLFLTQGSDTIHLVGIDSGGFTASDILLSDPFA